MGIGNLGFGKLGIGNLGFGKLGIGNLGCYQLNNSAENLSEKAPKAYFSLKSKIPYSNFISVEKWIKLFDSLITPIMTYGFQNSKLTSMLIDKLLLEKIKNMIFKNILGVHSKASNLAIQTELGYYLICIKSYKLMLKYYSSLVDIESSCDSKFNLLRATFIEDKNLYNNKHPSWVQTVFQLEKIMLNVKFTDTSYFDFKQLIEHLYKNTLLCQLEHMKLNDTGKLRFYNKICTSFDLKQYLSFDLPKFNRSLITKIRLKSTCDVNLLSKLSIIFKEWRVMNNVDRDGARV